MDKKKKSNPVLAYGESQQQSDRQKTKDYYNNKYKDVVKEAKKTYRDPMDMIFDRDEAKIKKNDENQTKLSRARTRLPGEIADQNRWIARGAKANALAKMKLKKKPMSEAQKKKIYGGE